MAVASSSSTVFWGVLSSPQNPKFKPFFLPLHPNSTPLKFNESTLTFAARKKNTNSAITPSSKKKKSNSNSNSRNKKKSSPKKVDVEVVDDIDEDAIEALFKQLEQDLKSDESFEDGDEDVTEEDLARLEKEFKEAFGEDADLFEMLQLRGVDIQNIDDAEDDDDEEEEETPVQLPGQDLKHLT